MDEAIPADGEILRDLHSIWPRFDWSAAKVGHGAFHRVVRLGTTGVVRVVLGAANDVRAQAELRNLEAIGSLPLPFEVPALRSGVQALGRGSAYLTSFVRGEVADDRSWEAVSEPIAVALSALHASTPTDRFTLRPTRDWCGGTAWPGVVDEIVGHLEEPLRGRAAQVVADVLEIERNVDEVLTHGDFGPHNILLTHDGALGLIDFDNACFGDPAIDLAPLIGAFGSDAVSEITDMETIRRARIHRASLSRQVAAAAHLTGDVKLRNHALRNFVDRAEAGTLYEPAQIR